MESPQENAVNLYRAGRYIQQPTGYRAFRIARSIIVRKMAGDLAVLSRKRTTEDAKDAETNKEGEIVRAKIVS
jgi:hypothetical protein